MDNNTYLIVSVVIVIFGLFNLMFYLNNGRFPNLTLGVSEKFTARDSVHTRRGHYEHASNTIGSMGIPLVEHARNIIGSMGIPLGGSGLPLAEHLENGTDLCRVSLNGGLASTVPQNSCNPTASGVAATDWMCRNDGYNASNVVGLGGEHMSNSRNGFSKRVNSAISSRTMSKHSAEKFGGQTSRPIHMSKPKRNALHESMVSNCADPFSLNVFVLDAGSANPYKNKAGYPTERMESCVPGDNSYACRAASVAGSEWFSEHLDNISPEVATVIADTLVSELTAETPVVVASAMIEDTSKPELDAVAIQTANTIKVLQAVRDNDLSSLDTLYNIPADVKAELANIDGEQDAAKLNELLSGQVAKLKVIQAVAAIKDAGFVVDANQTPEQIEAVYRSVVKNRRSRSVGPFPFILSPNECADEGDWKSIVPANSCNPSYSKTLSHKMKEGFNTMFKQLVGTPEACGSAAFTAGVAKASNYCASQRFQKALGAGSTFLQDYAKVYGNLEAHCESDYNSSGGNNRMYDGGAWRNDRYQHGCKYNEFAQK